MNEKALLKKIQKEWHGTLKSYITGFVLSLILTSLSFYLTLQQTFSKRIMIYSLISLAIAQAVIQLIFFYILDKKKNRNTFFSHFVFPY